MLPPWLRPFLTDTLYIYRQKDVSLSKRFVTHIKFFYGQPAVHLFIYIRYFIEAVYIACVKILIRLPSLRSSERKTRSVRDARRLPGSSLPVPVPCGPRVELSIGVHLSVKGWADARIG